jgi:hypothetical protein
VWVSGMTPKKKKEEKKRKKERKKKERQTEKTMKRKTVCIIICVRHPPLHSLLSPYLYTVVFVHA